MNSNIQTIIQELEEEKSNLENLIKKCVKKHNYLFAHFHHNALKQVKLKLHKFRCLENEMYNKKRTTLSTIKKLEELQRNEQSNPFRYIIDNKLQGFYDELQKLNETAPVQSPVAKSPILDKYFDLLLDKKLRTFQLVLDTTINLLLEIKRIKGTVRVTMPHVYNLKRIEILSETETKNLFRLGFKLFTKPQKLVLTLTGDKIELKEKLSTNLMIIFFEVFEQRDFKGRSCIKLLPKAMRDK